MRLLGARLGLSTLAASLALAGVARAEDAPRLDVKAGEVEIDPRSRTLELRRDIVLGWGRARLRAERLRLSWNEGSATLDGLGHLAFCGCDAPPVTLGFTRAKLYADGDLELRSPRLEVAGFPLLALPWILLRPPNHVGLLFPSFAVRGQDGLFVGSGVHVPWIDEDDGPRALDVLLGGYARGGVETGALLVTPSTSTRSVIDYRDGARVVLDARGLIATGDTSLAWSADALRGPRALTGTPELEPAARAYDVANVEASLRSAELTTAIGGEARAARGEDPYVLAPRVLLGGGGSAGRGGTWEVVTRGGALATDREAMPLAIAAVGLSEHTTLGPLELGLSSRARARYASADAESSSDAVAGAGVSATLPFSRRFGELTHVLEPGVEARASLGASRGDAFSSTFGAAPDRAFAALGVLGSTLGRGSSGARASLRGGVAGEAGARAFPLGALHAGLGSTRVAIAVDATLVRPTDELASLILARARLGAPAEVVVRGELVSRRGPEVREARALLENELVWLPGEEPASFATATLSGAVQADVPIARVLRVGARADSDLDAGRLLAVRGRALFTHPCGCLALGLVVGRRVGRDGTDALLTIDLAPGFAPSSAAPAPFAGR